MLDRFKKITIKPALLFIIGLVITIVFTLILYLFLPVVDFVKGSWSVYGPRESTPHILHDIGSFTNIDLLIKLESYFLGYWLIFSTLYMVLGLRKINLNVQSVWFHFGLSMLGFLLVVALNEYILLLPVAHSGSFYLSDIYIGADVSMQFEELNKLVITRNSLISSTSWLGFFFILVGIILFIINAGNGLRASKYIR